VDAPTPSGLDTEADVTATAGGAPAASATTLAPGTRVGRYEIVEKLGSGGMGVVYRAHDPKLARPVALKLLHPHAEGTSAALELQREAQAIARLAHPNVVTVHDVGIHEGRVFVAMEYVEGGTLDAWLRAAQRHHRTIVEMFVAAGRGLAAAHAAGIVHRDFKPANVLIGREGRARVADFGIARALDEDERDVVDELDLELLVTARTRTGALIGTPAYMAPEQLRGEASDARADQFAFCVSLYQALYGERPFGGESVQALVVEVLEGQVRKPPRGRKVPGWLHRIVMRGLAREPAGRWPDMPTLLAKLERGLVDRSQRLVVALMAPIGLTLLTLIARDVMHDPCVDEAAAIDLTWSQSTRERVIDRLGAREGEVLAMRIDRWVQLWKSERESMCVQRGGYDDWSRRRVCLERQHRQLDLYLELLERGGEHARGALEGFEELDAPRSCEAGGRPLPHGEVLRSEVETLAYVLDDAVVRLAAGDFAGAETSLDAIEPAISASKWRQLTGELALQRGRLHAARAEREAGEPAFRQAIVDALAVGDEHLAAEAMIGLAGLIAEWDARHVEALELLRMADALASHLSDRNLAGEIALARAAVLEQRGEFEPGLAAAERALAAWQPDPLPRLVEQLLATPHPEWVAAEGPPGLASPELTQARYRAAMLLYRLGRIPAAQARLDVARRGWGNAHERNHPTSLALVLADALLAGATGDWTRASERFDELVQIHAQTFGPEHLEVGDALANLGAAQTNAGHFVDARSSLARAVAIRERELGPDDVWVAHALANLASVEARLGEHAQASDHARRALALLAAKQGERHHDVMVGHAVLAEVLDAAGDRAGAREQFERALALAPEVGSDLQRLEFELQLARLALHEGELERTTTHLDAADRLIAAATPVPVHALLHAYLHARLATARGEHDEARRFAAQAREQLSATRASGLPIVHEAEAWLAASP
jgi:tetratricopeptide (TPR) repeat protein/predicted Ser/Thr protein kinase